MSLTDKELIEGKGNNYNQIQEVEMVTPIDFLERINHTSHLLTTEDAISLIEDVDKIIAKAQEVRNALSSALNN